MKTNFIYPLILVAFCFLPSTFGQGALTPPGAPAPEMKTLAQIEPRTPISSAPFTITNSGSYYLTTNLTVSSGNAITIATNGVTLDLGGFTIASTAPSAAGAGIWLTSSLRNLAIFNGFIRSGVTNNGSGVYGGAGFQDGINYQSVFNGHTYVGFPVNARVHGVSVFGCLGNGIYLSNGDSTTVEFCTAQTIGGSGIVAAVVKQCVALDCGSAGIYGDVVADCEGQSYAGAAVDGNIVKDCYGTSITGMGISANAAENCYGTSSSNYGVSANTAMFCYGNSVSYVGLYAFYLATSCCGQSGSVSQMGLYALNAAFCTAIVASGTAIEATVANGCYASSGTNLITYKYNMP